MQQTREPIISVLGHVDHGKTTVLDWIRTSVVASREAGGITQHIGATDIPFELIKKICAGLLSDDKMKLPLRGLLFVDTPGHESFTTLRKRGGSVADIAILVIDITEGLKPQTKESIEILRQFKTPFIIAANKVDKIPGWIKDQPINKQSDMSKEIFNKHYYQLMGDVGEMGLNINLYNQISDFTQEVAIIPVSGLTGEGIPILLTVLIGLTQQYLGDKLDVGLDTPAKGTVLEIKETKGLGTTADAIIYDGTIKTNDSIVVGGHPPVLTRVKALLRPEALDEMRDPKKKFKSVDEVYAASGVKIVAPGLENAMAGSPIYVGGEEMVSQIEKELSEVEFETDITGVVVKADTLGSLEALVKILSEKQIPIKKGSIGKISKQDIIEASAVSEKDHYLGIILGFNSSILPDASQLAEDKNQKIFSSPIVYQLLEDYEEWVKQEKEKEKKQITGKTTYPAKFKFMPGCIFRQSKPAVCGVEIINGTLQKGAGILRGDGKVIGYVREIQDSGDKIDTAKEGMQVAISIDNVTVGRQMDEGDVLYTAVKSDDVEKLKKAELSDGEISALKEIIEIRKKK